MAKAKGKEKPASSDVPAEIEDATGNDATVETTPSEPVKTEAAVKTTDTGMDEAEEAEEEESSEEEEEMEEEKNLDEADKGEAKEVGNIDAEMTPVVPENEQAEKGDKKEVVTGDKEVENMSNKKGKKARRRKKKAASNGAGANNAAAPKDAVKPESSSAEKGKFAGLIFMCNSKTKKDCYRYKVLGLPENKKETVAKVYKGMRLFLYDFDLKLMYGIYKAVSPGGYEIEPKAFKSAFPSQVRFTTLNDCKPLSEEKFRAAIKSNYHGRNKFNCQLSPEQVKNLTKLFMSENKTPLKQKRGVPREPISAGRDKKREPIRRFHVPSYSSRVAPLYPREAYISPPAMPVVMAPQPPSYAYDRPVEDYYYRRDPPLEFRDPRVVETRPRDPIVSDRDPYSSYRTPVAYREPLYPASLSSAYAPPPASSAYAPHPASSAYAAPPPHYRY